MSTFHEQAMSFVYQQVLHRLTGFFSRHERIALQLLIQRLLVAAGGIERIGQFRVMVVHEGGKESAYTLAFLRAAQLSIAARAPVTFMLRLAVLRQPRLTASVMARFHNQCNELFLYDDDRVELLQVDETGAHPVTRHTPFSECPPEAGKLDVLMWGHVSEGDARATFLYSDLLSRAPLFQTAYRWGGAVNALIDRRPPPHLGEYAHWMLKVAEQLGHCEASSTDDVLPAALDMCLKLEKASRSILHPQSIPAETPALSAGSEWVVINVFDCLSCEVEVLNSEALNFTEGHINAAGVNIEEPQAAVILVEAHVQGLRHVYTEAGDYCSGVSSYLHALVWENECNSRYKGQLVSVIAGAFNTPKRIQKLRQQMADYLNDLYNVKDEQISCFIQSPFVEQGGQLAAFVQRNYPDKLPWVPDLHDALQAHPQACARQAAWLETVSGLPLKSLQALYTLRKIDLAEGTTLIDLMGSHDPARRSR